MSDNELSCPHCGSPIHHDTDHVGWEDDLLCDFCGRETVKWRWNGDPQSGNVFEWDSKLTTTLNAVNRDELRLLEKRMFEYAGNDYTVETTTWTDGSWQAMVFTTSRPWRYTIVRYPSGVIRGYLTHEGDTLDPHGDSTVVWSRILYDTTGGTR